MYLQYTNLSLTIKSIASSFTSCWIYQVNSMPIGLSTSIWWIEKDIIEEQYGLLDKLLNWLIYWLSWLATRNVISLPPPCPVFLHRLPCLSALSCWRALPCLHLPGKMAGSRRESWHGRTPGRQMWWLSAAPSTLDPARLRLQSQSEQRSLLHRSQYPGKTHITETCICMLSNTNLAYLMDEERRSCLTFRCA